MMRAVEFALNSIGNYVSGKEQEELPRHPPQESRLKGSNESCANWKQSRWSAIGGYMPTMWTDYITMTS